MNNVVSFLIFFSTYDLLSHQGISVRVSRNGCTITYIINPWSAVLINIRSSGRRFVKHSSFSPAAVVDFTNCAYLDWNYSCSELILWKCKDI